MDGQKYLVHSKIPPQGIGILYPRVVPDILPGIGRIRALVSTVVVDWKID